MDGEVSARLSTGHRHRGLARVVGDGACAFFRTGSLALAAGLVAAISELPDIDGHPPDIDVRPDGVTVRLISASTDYMGMTQRDIELARQISGITRTFGLAADPSAVQSVLIVPGAAAISEVMPFWQAALGYERRLDSPEEDLVDPRKWPAFGSKQESPR